MEARMEYLRKAARLIGCLWVISGSNSILAAQEETVSCNSFLQPRTVWGNSTVGQRACSMVATPLEFRGHQFSRVDMRVSGTVAGYATQEGRMANYFNDGPDFVLAQFGYRDWVSGLAEYHGEADVGINVIYPRDRSLWNGKLWIIVTGIGLCSESSSGESDLDFEDPLRGVSRYGRSMLTLGYALGVVRRAVVKPEANSGAPACSRVVLENGTVVENMNFTDHAGIHLGLVGLAENFLEDRLGQIPSRTYWYGHSSGARVGRLINYKSGLNRDLAGRRIIDGFLGDDSGTGLWLPLLFQGGREALLSESNARQEFAPQIDITHQLYANVREHPLPDFVSPVYLLNKRRNALLLRQKGLESKHRVYEVRGTSHRAGEYDREVDANSLDLSRMMEAQIILLDNWVEQGVEPPPSRSDWGPLGDRDQDGVIEHAAVSLPEVACPLGVFYPYREGVQTTAFAPFDGQSVEPRDSRGVFVDMNGNGVPDLRESVTEAWHRLGLLEPGESFSRERFVSCVGKTVDGLKDQSLLTPEAALEYVQRARSQRLPVEEN